MNTHSINTFVNCIFISTILLTSCEAINPTRNNEQDPKSNTYLKPPAGTFIIGNGIATNQTDIKLTINVPGATEMQFSNDLVYWSGWRPYNTEHDWTLSSGSDGARTMYGEFKNNMGDSTQTSSTIQYDTAAPTGVILVNDGDVYSTSRNVSLANNITDTVSMALMRFSNDGTTWSAWENFSNTKSWLLTETEGSKTVYSQFSDSAGNLFSTSDVIVFDLTPQSGSFVIYNSINLTDATNSTSVTIHNNIAESTSMRFSNDGTSWSTWEPYASTKGWTLSSGLGTKIVYGEFRDNQSIVIPLNDSILYETTPPSGSMTINSNSDATINANVTINNAITDAITMRFSNDGSSWSAWEPYAAIKDWSLTATSGTKTVYAQYCDPAGNVLQINDSIILKTLPTITIQNLRNASITCSGFVIGAASDEIGISKVELQIDGGSYALATGTSSWKFQLPKGANTWRDGTQHTLQARVTDTYGFTNAISITVRKGANQDVNGDGYADVIVGACQYSSNGGRTYIFHSAGSSGITSQDLSSGGSAHTTLTGESISYFGQSVALGDVNGDGYADAIVGAYNYNIGKGRAYVFYSTGSSGIASALASSASTILTGVASSLFGWSVALGDVNGDGYADAIVGSRSSQEHAFVFHSAGSSGIASQDLSSGGIAHTTLTGESSSQFGCSVALGDVNGDGYADAIVGAWGYASNQGRTYIFHSAGSSGITSTSATLAPTILTGEGGFFGWSVALGDVNGDGYADAIVGAYQYSSLAGRAYIFHSTGSIGIASKDLSSGGTANTTLPGSTNTEFGHSVALGDVNGDGYADAIVGADYLNVNQGRVSIFHSAGSAGINTIPSTYIYGESNGKFGYSVALGDINGDGYSDAIVGAPHYSSQGRAYVFHSAGSSGIASQNLSSGGTANTTLTGESSSQLGYSVALNNIRSYDFLLAYTFSACVIPSRRRREVFL